MTLVSVLLPFRDAEWTIAQALDSVLTQRGVAYEVIAVDDRSRDRSAQMVASCNDRRIVLIRGDGRGIASALECARAHAKGTLLARMDADDVALPDRFAAQVDALRSTPQLAAVGTQVELFGDAVGEGMRRYLAWQNALITPDEHRRDLFVEAPLCHPSVMLRADAVAAVGGYRDFDGPEDYDLWLRLDAAGWSLAKVPQVLLRWRRAAACATFVDPRYRVDAFRSVKAHHLAARLRSIGRPLAVWGAGPTGRRLARALEPHGLHASLFIDIDRGKIGRQARGVAIAEPDALVRGAQTIVVAVGARGARELVREWLRERGHVEGADFVCAS